MGSKSLRQPHVSLVLLTGPHEILQRKFPVDIRPGSTSYTCMAWAQQFSIKFSHGNTG